MSAEGPDAGLTFVASDFVQDTLLGPELAGKLLMDAVRNLLADLPVDLRREVFEPIVAGPGVRIERIVSLGHASPADFWYDQPQAEWVLVLRGAARLRFADADQTVEMQAGDAIHIAARRRHRVDWTTPAEPTVWLAVHYEAVDGRGGEP